MGREGAGPSVEGARDAARDSGPPPAGAGRPRDDGVGDTAVEDDKGCERRTPGARTGGGAGGGGPG